jgi:hypothetical protein
VKSLVVRTSRAPKAARLVSRGDAVEQGVYSLHSSFSAALNFLDGDKLVGLVAPSVGPGPANIVFSGPLPAGEGPLEISPDGLRCRGRAFSFSRVPVYRSSLDGNVPQVKPAESNLEFLLGWLPFHAPDGSLAFLLGGRPGSASGFDREARQWMKTACEHLFDGSLAVGAGLIKGAGRGLTPSGDDFLCGVLSALDAASRLSGKDLSERRDAVYTHSLAGNPLSNAFLGFARRGLYAERFKALASALLCGEPEEVEREAGRVVRFGATSGADWLTGFSLALDRWRGLWS